MKTNKLVLYSLLSSLGVLAYVTLVVNIMNHNKAIFSQVPEIFAGIGMLLLFVISALITGLLVLGWPVYLYFDNEKKTAVKVLLANASWLIIITITFFFSLVIWQ